MWCTLIDLVNNSVNTSTMYQEGIPNRLRRDYGSTKEIAKASAAGIKAMIEQDLDSYHQAVEMVGAPTDFPFVMFEEDFLSSDQED